jgi:hypothetical protein
MTDRSAVIGVDGDFAVLFEQVRLLRELAAEAEATAEDGRVYDFGIRWGTMLAGRLARLRYYHERGELAPADEERYARLRTEMAGVADAVHRFRLSRPVFGAAEEEAERSMPSAQTVSSSRK